MESPIPMPERAEALLLTCRKQWPKAAPKCSPERLVTENSKNPSESKEIGL